MGLTLYFSDLTPQTPVGYRLEPESNPLHSKEIRSNPDMNRTFLGRPEVVEDVFLGCYYNGVFVGACLGTYLPEFSNVINMHPAIDRVNYKDTISIFAELACLWCLANGKHPILTVPDNMPNVQGWVERTLGWNKKHSMESTRNIEGVDVTSSVYLKPDGWTPRYVNNVVFNWRN